MAQFFVTGARGFIGMHLVRHLSEGGHRVAGLGHGLWPEPSARAAGLWPWINGDVSVANLRLLQKQCFTPEAVFHLAGGSSVGVAIANPLEDFHRTVLPSIELLEWVRQDASTTKVISISSAAVYGNGHFGQISEGAALTPSSPYGHHKRMMEELCASFADSYGVDVRIARLFSVYGPGLRKQLLWDLCSRLAGGANTLNLGGTGDELRDWTDVRDISRALVHVHQASSFPNQVVNVGTGRGTSVREIAGYLARYWSNEDRPVPIGFSGITRPGDPFSLIADPRYLDASGFAWSADLEMGIRDYVSWFRSLPEAPW